MPDPIGYVPPSYYYEANENPGPAAPDLGVFSITASRAVNNISFIMPPNNGQVIGLPAIPPTATQAHIYVEAADGAVNNAVLIRFWQDGSWPDQYSGIPLKDGQSFQITGKANVNNARLISADGLSHVLQVQYFNN